MEREAHIEQLLHEIRGVLACQQISSIESYAASAELHSFFESRRHHFQPSTTAPKPSVPQEKQDSEPRVALQSDHSVLAEIAAEVAKCRSCALSEQRRWVVPGREGSQDIRLLIVGHWLSLEGEEQPHTVFGVAEDQMLERMLVAMKLPMEEVMVCNVLKCSVALETRPQAEHIDACSSYLRRQIAAAAPEVICTMGMVATRSLLRLNQPLSSLRGKFHALKGADGIETPLLTTYHPGYLLKNPEMKNATWEDLQLIQKHLGLV